MFDQHKVAIGVKPPRQRIRDENLKISKHKQSVHHRQVKSRTLSLGLTSALIKWAMLENMLKTFPG